ncbi:MAG TPA: pantoate--beta-alanine ligase, partial [candidate division Zixibacteria bacterium]|nr:pantoate--beta-alanine ligase [candidate division Zixibacteria bacterium]
VVTSIFVNPTQFAPNEDLANYPRNERGDIAKIRAAAGDAVFVPKVEEIYPQGFQTYVTVEDLTTTLEGASRPTHFRGVTTIVAKLFNIVRPDVVVFGMKDYQQSVVLRRMTVDLGYPVKFIVAPTVRERDGLAMSSRNKYFDSEQRKEAICLYEGLRHAKRMAEEKNAGTASIRAAMRKTILKRCPAADIEYIAFTRFDDLSPVKTVVPGTVCSLAVRVHGVRLIDNLKLR